MFFVFSLFFTALGLISWLYPAEIFPTAIRARGSSLATATNWSLNLVFAQCSPIALTTLQYKYFYCFVAFNWAAAVIVWAFYPETGGKSLEEVAEVFTTRAQQRRRGQSYGSDSTGADVTESRDVKSGVTLHVAQK
ncbi:uncharacterized protein CDV56_102951 [Aspergillus thermomutatus]|uniref:Major facilitator superfamily (MFS) profile domain-containing protein n=1 Tax=Aspergillus thermomutatus TaxID=41047 RepID=A0A397FYS1_ASPTH|nr:uncharacterized protein CDV56_102951 [Aspergillus thermomutatus]RHZ43677.1 hypothetical protein CDV56_102951 [Aspergillus thermomutatus]